jgi:hypothetical protein
MSRTAKKAAAADYRGDDEGGRENVEITGRVISPWATTPVQTRSQVAAPSRRARETASNKVAAHFSIADGRIQLGAVDLIGGRYVAVDLDANTIGSLPSLKSAAAASFDGGRR